jgi:hypothetical protein
LTKYHLTWKGEPHPVGVVPPADLEEGVTYCDRLIALSQTRSGDGYSTRIETLDGRAQRPLSMRDLWQAWVQLGSTLSSSAQLSNRERAICQLAGSLRDLVLSEAEAQLEQTALRIAKLQGRVAELEGEKARTRRRKAT